MIWVEFGDSMNGWAMWAFKKFCDKGLNLELHGYKVPNWWKRLKDYGDSPKLLSLVCVCKHSYSKPLVTLTSKYQMRW